jgi:hypothetical protein
MELPLSSVTMSSEINAGGELRATFYLDSTGYDNATVKLATEPGFCYLVAEKAGSVIWGGIIWARTYQSDGKNLELYCKSYEKYPSYRLMSDFSMTGDQLDIFIALWNTLQGEAGSNLNMVVPASFPKQQTVTQTVHVLETDYQDYGTLMDQLANGDIGFDWIIDWARLGNSYLVTLRAEQPNLGAALSDDSLTFDYPGNIINYWETDSVSDSGTDVYTLGAGQGDSALISITHRQDLIDSGYLRIDLIAQSKNTTDQKTLNQLAKQQAALSATPINNLVVVQKADRDPIFGSWGIGDYCNLSFLDAWHTVTLNTVKRIIRWDYNPPEQGSDEEVQFTFEGIQVSDS